MFPRLIISFILIFTSVLAQDTSRSLAFRKNRSVERYPIFYRPDLSNQLLQQFKLIQEANSGDPIAQHELGLRLLFGDGISADTTTAVKWIQRAAMQNLSAAQYNYALALINGIGIDWNPFDAFNFLKKASTQNFAPAQYILGIFYADNLIVPRNLRLAYYWINKSRLNGYKVEEDIIRNLEAKLPKSFIDSLSKNQIAFSQEIHKAKVDKESFAEISSQAIEQSIGLSFIDFDAKGNNNELISEINLIQDLIDGNIIKDSLSLNIKSVKDFAMNYDKENLLALAGYDIPEILVLLGYMYKEGMIFEKDELKAAEYFILAVRYDSPRAPLYLIDLVENKSFYQKIKNELAQKNNSARFVWYGLTKFGFIDGKILNDAFDILNEAAKSDHLNSINELALNYYVGNIIQKDVQRSIDLWTYSENLGSKEATIRIILSEVFDENKKLNKNIFNSLLNFEEKGSILSQVAIGFCYEKGRGTKMNKAFAVKYYRKAAQRGNLYAYQRLKNLYDQIRPKSSEYMVE